MSAIRKLTRILGRQHIAIVIFVLAAPTIIILGIRAYTGFPLDALILMGIALMWLTVACANSYGWRRSNEDWGRTLGLWNETSELCADALSLLHEALTGLSTYDREKADDIAGRAHTIVVLRQKNIDMKAEEL